MLYWQAMYQQLRLEPYAVHTTFQYAGTEGKRHRLREAMVFYDPPEYYDFPGDSSHVACLACVLGCICLCNLIVPFPNIRYLPFESLIFYLAQNNLLYIQTLTVPHNNSYDNK